jgi:hypothetical protein
MVSTDGRCLIELWRGYVSACFYARPEEQDVALCVSPPFRRMRMPWRRPVPLDRDPAAAESLETLVEQLVAAGWQRSVPRPHAPWYQLRFERTTAQSPREPHGEPEDTGRATAQTAAPRESVSAPRVRALDAGGSRQVAELRQQRSLLASGDAGSNGRRALRPELRPCPDEDEPAAASGRDTQPWLAAALDLFTADYLRLGGHHYHGFSDVGDPANYKGPTFWSKGDCVLRLALRLETTFPGRVHLEVPFARQLFDDFDRRRDRRRCVDLVVSDLVGFRPGIDVFGRREHDLFIAVRFLPKRGPKWIRDSKRTIQSIDEDAARLGDHLLRGHCRNALVVVVDDQGLFESERVRQGFSWPERVQLAVAFGACPVCGAGRIRPIVFGEPRPGAGESAARGEIVLGDRAGRGDDRDPVTACLDCRSRFNRDGAIAGLPNDGSSREARS